MDQLPVGPNGRRCCRMCGKEVTPPRRCWCSQECVDRFSILTDPGYVRALLFKRDKGVCALCRLDTVKAHKAWSKQKGEMPYQEWHDAGKQMGFIRSNSRNAWDADHIVPVCEGGGECSLENYRTVCIPCHKDVTAALAARRAKKESA
ncbi:MAG TPA: HNH endonuclease signature motif containing protein [Bryobacteraceae bacterium]|nr:HNH endonuclease signature motif containing protein [Bryobacteraceae bacterium]